MTALILAIVSTGMSGLDDSKSVSTEWGWIQEAFILDGLKIKHGITIGKFETVKSFDGHSIINHNRNQSYLRLGDFAVVVHLQFLTKDIPVEIGE